MSSDLLSMDRRSRPMMSCVLREVEDLGDGTVVDGESRRVLRPLTQEVGHYVGTRSQEVVRGDAQGLQGTTQVLAHPFAQDGVKHGTGSMAIT